MPDKSTVPSLVAVVAVGLPVHGTYDYSVPAPLQPFAKIGVRVQVPFGKRKIITGFITELKEKSERGDLRDIDDIPDPEPAFGAAQLEFYRFIAGYYFAPLGETIRTALPAGLFKGTHPVLAITPLGRKALNGPVLEELDRRILGLLAGGEELTPKALTNRVGQEIKTDIQRLMRWAFIEQRYRLAPLTARRKTETVWRLHPDFKPTTADQMLGRSTPKRTAVLQLLARQTDWINIQHIGQEIRDPRSTLNLMVSAGLVQAEDREVYRDVECLDDSFNIPEFELHPEQRAAIDAVAEALRAGRYQPYCLYGVTGSGKTEVYLQLVKRCLDLGRSAIVLVPEISLTPQFLGRFVCRLGPVIAPYHSRLSDGERYDQWRKMRRGEAQVVVGARSALFAPFEKIGLIVVDEEHEASFKQDDGVPYHARDLALKLGTLRHCPVVLGSATPSLETFAAARAGRYRLLQLTERPSGAAMPRVDIVDMRQEMAARKKERIKDGKKNKEKTRLETSERRVLSKPLLEALTETCQAGEQTILFLNRRGYSTFVFCLECGQPLKCKLCDISLTFHEKERQLHCHYCNFSGPPPPICPNCAGLNLFYGGMGTERLEKEIAEHLPEARISRMDRDTTKGKGDLHRILSAFFKGEADILVGTQMVAKGHDFPSVTLVGIVDADAALMIPDFRAAERAYQLLSQVAGRAGRADKPGRAVLQTFQPEHYAIYAAARHDYPRFFSEEYQRRMQLGYPPLGRLAVLKIITPNAKIGLLACKLARQAGSEASDPADVPGAAVLGPSPSLLYRVQGKFHWNMLIKAATPAGLHKLCGRIWQACEKSGIPQGVFRLDVDPSSVI